MLTNRALAETASVARAMPGAFVNRRTCAPQPEAKRQILRARSGSAAVAGQIPRRQSEQRQSENPASTTSASPAIAVTRTTDQARAEDRSEPYL